MSERGHRLRPSPAELNVWRSEFARNLREKGVPANATPRRLRGETKPRVPDGLYRAILQGESTHLRRVLDSQHIANDDQGAYGSRAALLQARANLVHGWRAVGEVLDRDGHSELAERVREFVRRMPPLRTEKEWLTLEAGNLQTAHASLRARFDLETQTARQLVR
jgi:type IV secretion system T-DNA border endonuclease VirD2